MEKKTLHPRASAAVSMKAHVVFCKKSKQSKLREERRLVAIPLKTERPSVRSWRTHDSFENPRRSTARAPNHRRPVRLLTLHCRGKGVGSEESKVQTKFSPKFLRCHFAAVGLRNASQNSFSEGVSVPVEGFTPETQFRNFASNASRLRLNRAALKHKEAELDLAERTPTEEPARGETRPPGTRG